ncbi:uncharacterized protein LOC130784825 isoform X3 [Actinidia eriantha]|uniref:uncharacterized protein LOC130784825 isoform X3 n=1 Tax=Actinidia eriantha TaxID=165200 RepID=UPI00258DDD38|nr:uncharacterized protein LOC130784825 isoform X3 [Actinidia eriantha]
MKESLPRAGRKKGRKGMIKKGTTIGIEGGIEMGTGRETDIGIGIETKIITPETEIETALKNGVREGKGVGIEMMMTIIRGVLGICRCRYRHESSTRAEWKEIWW